MVDRRAGLELPRVQPGICHRLSTTLRHWAGLTLFLDDGRIELDTNTVEREIRRIPLGRKNALFAGNDTGADHWAELIKVPAIQRIVGRSAEGLMATLVATAKLNDVAPFAWLTDVLERIVSGRTKAAETGKLLPWNWKADRTVPEIIQAAA